MRKSLLVSIFLLFPLSIQAEDQTLRCELGTNPEIIQPQEGTTLWWSAPGATEGTLGSTGIYGVDLPYGYVWIVPRYTRAITMNVSNGANTGSCSTKAFVKQTPLPTDPIAGDFNKDGYISTADLTILKDEFGTSGDSGTDLNSDGVVDKADLALFNSFFGGSETPFFEDAEDGTVNKWSYQDVLRGRGAGSTSIKNIADPGTGNHYIRVWTGKFTRGALLEHPGHGWKQPVVEWKMRSEDRVFITFIVEIENSEAREVTYEFAPNDLDVSGESNGEWTSQVRDIREQLGENEVFASISQMKIRACYVGSCQAGGAVDIDNIRFMDS